MDEMERPPWWLSDDDPSRSRAEESSGTNWMSLLGSLGSLAGEWWAASGAGDHAHHGEPADHPECLVCRAVVTFSTTTTQRQVLPAVRWLPTRRL